MARGLIWATLLIVCVSGSLGAQDRDSDSDGLPDAFEDALLRKFVPQFQVSANDCDGAPAEFEPNQNEPKVKAKNGAIYGQVFPVQVTRNSGAALEIHYYHLWAQDCGQPGHALDAESISALLHAPEAVWAADRWQATYWYAAAHEDTLCDMSNGAKAAAVDAMDRGPAVWISRGKHASFLDRKLCAAGCGRDNCADTIRLHVAQIINLGEPGSALHGTEWASSASWPLASKMNPDFTEWLLARIGDSEKVALLPARDVAPGMRTTIRVAGNTYWSIAAANENAETAVASATDQTSTALNTAAVSTGGALQQANRAVKQSLEVTGRSLRRSFRWLGVGR